MAKTSISKINYPWTTEIGDRQITLRLMQPSDRDELHEFAQSLPPDDLLFLSVDITEREAVDEWIHNLKTNRVVTVLAEAGGELLGHGTLIRNNLTWTRHLGEIQLLIKPEARGLGPDTFWRAKFSASPKNAACKKSSREWLPTKKARLQSSSGSVSSPKLCLRIL